jgi:hypothetical protein
MTLKQMIDCPFLHLMISRRFGKVKATFLSRLGVITEHSIDGQVRVNYREDRNAFGKSQVFDLFKLRCLWVDKVTRVHSKERSIEL